MKRLQAKKIINSIQSIRKSASDNQAYNASALYPAWKEDGFHYIKDDRVLYLDILYKCLLDHDSQTSWNPKDASSLWVKVLNDVVKEWEQPTAENAYMKGDKVLHVGFTWVSTIDHNVWEPGVYGWDKV